MIRRIGVTIGCISLALTGVLSGCGGGGGNGKGSSGQSAQYKADLATIASVTAYLDTLTTVGRSAMASAALAYLQKNPSFVNPGISDDGTVYGSLQDGFRFEIETNDPTIDLQAGPAPSSYAVPRSPVTHHASSSVVGGGIPTGGEAYVINAFDSAYNSPAFTIAAELKAAGYHVTTSGGLLSDWTAINNAAVLFNSSHGARVPDPDTRALVFWQQSGQQPLLSDASWALPLMHSGALMVDEIKVPNGPIVVGQKITTHTISVYSFSAKYLTNHSMFAPNSLFWDESCSGTSSPGRLFASSLQQNNGLDVFAGWSQPMIIPEGNESSSFFFDRALGLNQFKPIDSSKPPPNDWNSILGIMQATDRASNSSLLLSSSDPSAYPTEKATPVSLLAFVNGSGSLATIIPSVAAMTANIASSELALSGSFGSTQGTVNLGSSPIVIKAWTPTQVTTQLPTVSGDLQVVSPSGTLSNTVAWQTAGLQGKATLTISGYATWATKVGWSPKPGSAFMPDGSYSYSGPIQVSVTKNSSSGPWYQIGFTMSGAGTSADPGGSTYTFGATLPYTTSPVGTISNSNPVAPLYSSYFQLMQILPVGTGAALINGDTWVNSLSGDYDDTISSTGQTVKGVSIGNGQIADFTYYNVELNHTTWSPGYGVAAFGSYSIVGTFTLPLMVPNSIRSG